MNSRTVIFVDMARSEHQLGDRVLIEEGPLRGVEGIVVRSKVKGSVVVSVTLLQRSVAVEVGLQQLRHLKSRDEVIGEQLHDVLAPITSEVILRMAENPSEVRQLDPRQFEYLIAGLLEDAGYEVRITPQSRDGGRDIIAVFRIPFGEVLTIVECKHFAEKRRIGPELIRQLLWVADRDDKASRALMATTASFTKGARLIEHEYQWRLKLADFEEISEWLKRFGKWKKSADGRLWMPKTAFEEED
jgi:hypothetical protein